MVYKKNKFKTWISLKLINWMSLKPISNLFGFDRGLPIDRVYIEKFLSLNSHLIKGTVVEIGGNDYTLKYGGSNVDKSLVLMLTGDENEQTLIANLETGVGVKENICDCFILTQTIPFIKDSYAVVRNVKKMLKPGGIALFTISGITPISRYDMDRWGHFCNYTDLGLKSLLLSCFEENEIEISTYGNVKVACAFLLGLAADEVKYEDYWYHDENYQVSICAIAKK